MNQYEITLINKNDVKRAFTVDADSEKEAITSDIFKQHFKAGESILNINVIQGLTTYEMIIRDFQGRLSSKEVKASSVQEAVKNIQGELFFGAGKVIEVHKKRKAV